MADDLAATIQAALDKRADDGALPRRPDQNSPFAPVPQRPPRRTTRPYRDPVGQEAVGNINTERKRKP